MTIFTGEQCPVVSEFSNRGTSLWVLLAEDDPARYERAWRRKPLDDLDCRAGVAAMDAAIVALMAARDRLLCLQQVRDAETSVR